MTIPKVNENSFETEDETWAYGYDVKTKMQSLGNVTPQPKGACVSIKHEGDGGVYRLTHCELVQQDQTVNKEFFIKVLKHLRVLKSRRGMVCGKVKVRGLLKSCKLN